MTVDKVEKIAKPEVKKSDADRESFLKKAEVLGIQTKDLTDEQILFKVIDELNKTNERLATSMATNDAKSVKRYVGSLEIGVKNEDFLTRLMNLNIPSFYLNIFSEDDCKKTDSEIWTMINKSGINPFTTFRDAILSKDKYSNVNFAN